MLVCGICFLWICRNFCIVFKRIDHIFDRSTRNSDPGVRIVLVHGLNSNFNSILLAILVQFSYFLGSTLLVEKLGRLVEGCIRDKPLSGNCRKITNVLGHEILSNFNNTHKSCFLTKFPHSVFWSKRFNLLNVLLPNDLVIHGVFVLQGTFCFDFAENNYLTHQNLKFP